MKWQWYYNGTNSIDWYSDLSMLYMELWLWPNVGKVCEFLYFGMDVKGGKCWVLFTAVKY